MTDPCSLANLQDVKCSHFHLSLKANFKDKTLEGSVTHTAKFVKEKPEKMILDTRNLSVSNVKVEKSSKQTQVCFSHDEKEGPLGVPLQIDLSKAYEDGTLTGDLNETFNVQIHYHTTPESVGIQWLEANQTDSKQHPYLFTQFQAIHCRTAVPCQDSPSNKVTYTAEIEVPKELTALMSAISNECKPAENDSYHRFTFTQVSFDVFLVRMLYFF